MACSTDFIDFVCEQLAPLGDVWARKMMADAETGCPYPGAKEAYILDLSRPREVQTVIKTLWEQLPFPKPRKKSGAK